MLEVEREHHRSRLGIHLVKHPRIRSRKINFPVPHRRRPNHPRSMVRKGPKLLPTGRIHGIKTRIPATKINHPIHHRRRSLNPHLVVNVVILASLESPFLRAGSSVQRIKIRVPTSHIQDAIRNRRRSMHHVACLKFPFQFPRFQIQRINIRIPAPKINRPAGNHWRRQIKIKRIGHRFRRRLRAMQMLPGKTPLAVRLEFPFQFSRRRV